MAFVFNGCDFQGQNATPDPTIWGRYEDSAVKDAIDQIWSENHINLRIWIATRLTLRQRICVLGFRHAINCRFGPFQAPGAPAQTCAQFMTSLNRNKDGLAFDANGNRKSRTKTQARAKHRRNVEAKWEQATKKIVKAGRVQPKTGNWEQRKAEQKSGELEDAEEEKREQDDEEQDDEE